MKSNHKKDIKFGNSDILEKDEFNPKHGKERITLFVDQQVVDAFREKAEIEGEKYQALMRKTLRDFIYKKNDLEERITRIENSLFKKEA